MADLGDQAQAAEELFRRWALERALKRRPVPAGQAPQKESGKSEKNG
ncbi:hypothetical protein [Telmatospirillum sp. J64-1]|nr:hypothetical protein [Telmatospirillum sp. J64-1]